MQFAYPSTIPAAVLAQADPFTNLAQWVEHFEGGMAATALLMLFALALLLPKGSRRLTRQPLGMLIAYVIVAAIRHSIPDAIASQLPLQFTALLLLLFSIARTGFLLTFRSIPGARFTHSMPRILLDIIQGVLFILALLLALHVAGADPTSLVTGSALITAAIGLSMKDTLGNVFAGLAIQAQRPFEVGDWIQFDDRAHHIGEVVEINWRVTKVMTLDQVEVTIPNGVLAQSPIRNFTKPEKYSRRSVYVTAPYDVPPRKVARLIMDAISGSYGVLRQPPPTVVTNAFTERGVEYWVRFFTAEFDKRDGVDGGVRDRIWYALNREGITIPGPIRQVYLDRTPDSEQREELERIDDRKRALKNVDFLDELPDEAISRLANSAKRRLYAAGETIIEQGDSGTELFIIASGEVGVYVRHSSGYESEINRLGREQFFGEMSCMTGLKRSATVRAMTDCELYLVDKSAFQPILEETPELANHMSEVLALRQAELLEHSKVVGDQRQPVSATQQRIVLLDRIKDFFSLR